LDTAERTGNVDAGTRASAVYLELRKMAGLTVAGASGPDDYDRFLADLLRATPGDSNPAHD
jgi:hypothetical protein